MEGEAGARSLRALEATEGTWVYSNVMEKPQEGFKQGSEIIQSIFGKDYPRSFMENRLSIRCKRGCRGPVRKLVL